MGWHGPSGECGCCGDECRDTTFAPGFETFPIRDGENNEGLWDMDDGDELQPPPGALSSGAEAWFHTIHTKEGDFDLTWGNILIQLRAAAGEVAINYPDDKYGGSPSVFVRDADLPSSWQYVSASLGTYLTLYVTPSWFAVIVLRSRIQGGFGRDTRGSIQVFDRDNTTETKSATLKAVSNGAVVASWRAADATFNEVPGYPSTTVEGCVQPSLPGSTERYFRSQSDLLESIEWTATVADHEVVRTEPDPATVVFRCELKEVRNPAVEVGDTFGLASGGTEIDTAFSDAGWAGSVFDAGGGSGFTNGLPGMSIGGGSLSQLPIPSTAERYPKPRASVACGIARNFSLGDSVNDGTTALVEYDNEGRAPFTLYVEIEDLVTEYFARFTPEQCASSLFNDEGAIIKLVDIISAGVSGE